MSLHLWKTEQSKMFGQRDLVEFLEEHGAQIDSKPYMAVPLGAFRAALEHADELALTDADIALIRNEIAEGEADEDDDIVDHYDLF